MAVITWRCSPGTAGPPTASPCDAASAVCAVLHVSRLRNTMLSAGLCAGAWARAARLTPGGDLGDRKPPAPRGQLQYEVVQRPHAV